jgi:two-component system sensor histidine kinase BaeS
MERLVDDLRTLSLAESGALPLHREPTDPAVLLEDVAAAHRARPEAASIAIKVAIDGSPAPVDVDPVRIRQVVSNLVDNAIRAMTSAASPAAAPAAPTADPGANAADPSAATVGGTITLAARVVDSRLVIDVVDDGPGIAPDLLGSVFDRFAKSAESRGSGLGLSIARAIVLAHGGTIEAISPPAPGSRGTRIRIALPAGAG